MSNTIKITTDLNELRSSVAPVYSKYDGQMQPQPAYIEMDIRSGAVSVDYSGEIGSAVPADVWHGLIRRYPINPQFSGSALAELLEDDELTSKLNAILAATEEVHDGSNYVGRISEAGVELEYSLEEWLKECFTEHSAATIWEADDLLIAGGLEVWWTAEQTLEEAVAELKAAAVSEGASLEVDPEQFLLDVAGRDAQHDITSVSKHQLDALIADGWKFDEDDLEEWHEAHPSAAPSMKP